MNTRRYPRTLREAFPRDVDYACAVERPEPARQVLRWAQRVAFAILAVGIAVGVIALILEGATP
jgi:hypothetical protein